MKAPLEELERYVMHNWRALPGCEAQSPPDRVSLMVQAVGVSKLIVLIFSDRSARPACVVKLARDPAGSGRLRVEAAFVERLRASVSPELARTLPGPFWCAYLAEQLMIFEPYVDGKPMDSLVGAGRPLEPAATRRVLDLALDWLIDIQQQTACRDRLTCTSPHAKELLGPIEHTRQVSELTCDEQAFLDALERRLSRSIAATLPRLLYHGDFRAGNVLVRDESLTVLDWEFSRLCAPPLLDWFSFAFRLYCQTLALPDIDGSLEAYRRAFQHVFLSRSWFATELETRTVRYCRAFDIDTALIPDLVALFVVDNINKFHAFLSGRVNHDMLYLLDQPRLGPDNLDRELRRQAYVWLLGDLAHSNCVWA